MDYVDEREQFWIKEKNSFVKNGEGYNITLGGQSLGRHKLIERDKVLSIINLLKTTELTQKVISEKEQVSPGLVSKINLGTYYPIDGVNYPIRNKNIEENIKQSIAYSLLNTKLKR